MCVNMDAHKIKAVAKTPVARIIGAAIFSFATAAVLISGPAETGGKTALQTQQVQTVTQPRTIGTIEVSAGNQCEKKLFVRKLSMEQHATSSTAEANQERKRSAEFMAGTLSAESRELFEAACMGGVDPNEKVCISVTIKEATEGKSERKITHEVKSERLGKICGMLGMPGDGFAAPKINDVPVSKDL